MLTVDEANGGKHMGLLDAIAYSMALAEFSQARSQVRGVMEAGQTSYEVIRVAWGNRTSNLEPPGVVLIGLSRNQSSRAVRVISGACILYPFLLVEEKALAQYSVDPFEWQNIARNRVWVFWRTGSGEHHLTPVTLCYLLRSVSDRARAP